MNEFDNLFNEYFGDKNGIDKMIKLMQKLNFGGGFGGMSPEESNLGEPDSVEEFEQDGIKFIKSVWETPHGQIIRMTTKEDVQFTNEHFRRTNTPTGRPINNSPRRQLSLEERLEKAKKEENYELCAQLRDEIKTRDEKKENKEKTTEKPDNKVLSKEDEWNF